MKKLMLFAACACVAALLGACTPAQETEPVSTAALATEEIPDFPMEAMQPLLCRIGIALGRDYVEDFDAARGALADRCFADALLYEFLNDELYDARIQPALDEESWMCALPAEDMLYLLCQLIGDYPALIDPPADMFLSRNEAGDYFYGHSDMGMVDYELKAETVTYLGEGVFELTADLYELYFDEEADEAAALLGNYALRFSRAEDSAYGYTITKIVKG